MKLVVIESPLSGDFERNRRYALWCAWDCYYERDEAAYASHLFFPQFLDDEDPEHRKFGMKAGLEWARRGAACAALYMDLGLSGGMEAAEKFWLAESGISIERRNLPPALMKRFEAGEIPNPTPGFADTRLALVFALLDEHDDARCDGEHEQPAAKYLVAALRGVLGVGPFERRRDKQ